jgi:hypothetical protein
MREMETVDGEMPAAMPQLPFALGLLWVTIFCPLLSARKIQARKMKDLMKAFKRI